MGKSQTLGTNMVFACYLLLKEANMHINLICFDRNFDQPHSCVVTFVPRTSPKRYIFSTKTVSVVVSICDLLLGLSSLFSQYSRAFLNNCYLIVVPLKI